MRKVLLTVALAALVYLPVMAQPGPGLFGRGGDLSAMLLANKDVQKEIKLTDDQKKDIEKAGKERQEAFAKAREDMDREGFQKAMETYTKAITKVKKDLKPEQQKRLLGIEVQVAEKNKTVAIFKNAEVVKALSLTEKQQDAVKELMSEYEKDAKEIFEEVKGDRTKFKGAFEKIQKMGGETFTKVTKSLTEKQQEAWKELKGEKFDVNLFGTFPKGKGKDRPKKSDDL